MVFSFSSPGFAELFISAPNVLLLLHPLALAKHPKRVTLEASTECRLSRDDYTEFHLIYSEKFILARALFGK